MKYTNKHKLPKLLEEALVANTHDISQTDQSKISITSLIEPPRIRQLKIRHWNEIEEDVSENIWRVFGGAIHQVLALAGQKGNRLMEERLSEWIGVKEITGRFDCYEEGEHKTLQDIKVTSVWNIIFKSSQKNWENQLNCYCYLMRKAGFEPDWLQIVAILRDWTSSKAKKDPKYPQIPVAIIPVEIWSIEKQRAYIGERVALHIQAEELTDDKLPECTPEEKWQDKTTWAVYKGKNKTATKVCPSEENAQKFMADYNVQYPKAILRLEKREGMARRCGEYCNMNEFCNCYQEKGGK